MYIWVMLSFIVLAAIFTILAVLLKNPDRPDRIIEIVLFGGIAVSLWWAAGVSTITTYIPYAVENYADNTVGTAIEGTIEVVEPGGVWVFFIIGVAVSVYLLYALFYWPERELRRMP